jgi:starch phosphorylase
MDPFELLRDIALNLRSAWNHRTDVLWEQIDPDLWRDTGNAWFVVQTASRERLRDLWATPAFRERAEALQQMRAGELSEPRWFQRAHAGPNPNAIAFFSLEYALSEALPIYSGGLGNVAGDYLKAAGDLGLPLVGVGLLYQLGYFRQVIDANGAQREFYPFNAPDLLPVVPMRDERGGLVRVRMPRPGPPLWLRGWEARIGRIRLYLLDSNDPLNTPADRGITGQLYGGGEDMRLLQEMALGIGGWRLLRAIGIRPDVCHLNEGHAALAALERARDFMKKNGLPFDVALAATRAGNLFTTHTPVEAGFDRFSPALAGAYLGAYAREELGLTLDAMLALGRSRGDDTREPFSMAWLAAHASGAVNAVSRRHAGVSRRIFQVLYPRWPEADVAVDYVTNGVHMPTWDSAEADALWTEACGTDRWQGATNEVGERVRRVSDAALWVFRSAARANLVSFVRENLEQQLAATGMEGDSLERAKQVLDPDALTIGFARRFTPYKRPTLLLHDSERLVRLLTDSRRRVQLVIAGKAHPRDDQGKAFVQEWVRFVRRPDVRARAVFLADYDLRVAEHIVQGVDVWINTPKPPWEACGTSGMKVLVNGGLNLSSLDGWWAEAYSPDVGWAIEGDGSDDRADAERVYDLLERQVVPIFYDRDGKGVPKAWVDRMRASMAGLTPAYSADRALREYTERYYVPLARAFAARSRNGAEGATRIVEWERALRQHWSSLRFGDVQVRTEGGRHIFAAMVYTDDLDPDSVSIELYADARGAGDTPTRTPMRRDTPLVGTRGFVYRAEVPDDRPASHFTPRAIPSRSDVTVPLELPLIAWPR